NLTTAESSFIFLVITYSPRSTISTSNHCLPNSKASDLLTMYKSNRLPFIAEPLSEHTNVRSISGMYNSVPNSILGGQAASPRSTYLPDAVIPYAGCPGALPVSLGCNV